MATKDQIDQDALAAEWGLALESDTGAAPAGADPATAPPADDAAAQWAAMADDPGGLQSAKGGAERILNQEEIDSLLGFSLADVSLNDNSGIRA
ncbi:MAG TPA: flagellar motor switch protein FliM, partial [Pseudolabrys sp.]|nr:flagellar motor switch protein FliM [Pseudolabrys sp.]